MSRRHEKSENTAAPCFLQSVSGFVESEILKVSIVLIERLLKPSKFSVFCIPIPNVIIVIWDSLFTLPIGHRYSA